MAGAGRQEITAGLDVKVGLVDDGATQSIYGFPGDVRIM